MRSICLVRSLLLFPSLFFSLPLSLSLSLLFPSLPSLQSSSSSFLPRQPLLLELDLPSHPYHTMHLLSQSPALNLLIKQVQIYILALRHTAKPDLKEDGKSLLFPKTLCLLTDAFFPRSRAAWGGWGDIMSSAPVCTAIIFIVYNPRFSQHFRHLKTFLCINRFVNVIPLCG